MSDPGIYVPGDNITISGNTISATWPADIVDQRVGAYLENTVYDNIQTYNSADFSGTLYERDYITCTVPLNSIQIEYGTTGAFGEAVIRFTMASTSTADHFATLPDIQWAGGTPYIELGKSYIISIKDSLGVCCEVTG